MCASPICGGGGGGCGGGGGGGAGYRVNHARVAWIAAHINHIRIRMERMR